MDTKINKKWNYIIGTVLFIVSWAILYHQFFIKRDISAVYNNFQNFSINTFDYILLATLVFLMFLNLFLESFKWKILISKYDKLNIFHCFKIILSGLAASLFLPWHTGDIFTKIISTKKNSKSNSLGLASIASFSQLFWTVFFGLIAIYFLYAQKINIEISTNYKYTIIGFSVILLIVLFGIIFLPSLIHKNRLESIRNIRFNLFVSSFTNTTIKTKISILLLSMIRYTVFSAQYLICFVIFDIDISIEYIFVFSSILFLLTSIIPSYLITDLSVRGSIAVYLIASIFALQNISGDSSIASLLIITTIWVINRLIPSVFGSFYLRKMNYLSMFAKK